MPDSSSSRYVLLNQLADDFAARFRRGERPSLQEYADRHPDLADDIRTLFPTLVEVEGARPGPLDAGGRGPAPQLERLGDYRIIREVGRGGMGIVYEAEQLTLGRRVALKVLPAASLMEPREVERFEREARAAAHLHHTNIVPVYGVGHEGGLRYYVMQFIQGQPLDAVLDELRHLRLGDTTTHRSAASAVAQSLLSASGAALASQEPQPLGALTRPRSPGSGLSGSGQPYWRCVARMGAQVADALAYAHGQGTLHRDIKPSNLLLDANGMVWVTDFGLAKATGSSNLTVTGEVVGTLRFIPPERFGGHSDARGDVYSLGLTLYEMLTLRPAFDTEDRLRLIEQILNSEPPPPRKIQPDVPRDLETVVLKSMARDPGHRYQAAAEFAADLRRFAEDRPVLARRIGPVERAARWCRKSPALASLLGVVAVLLLLGGVGGSLAALHFRAAAIQEANLRKQAQDADDANQKLLGEQYVAQGDRLLDQGDVSGALLWFVEALARDQDDEERAAQHRVRIGATLRQCPKPAHIFFHPAKVRAAVFSPDGKRVVTCSEDGLARTWDADTGEQVGEPFRHDGPVTAARFSPDGQRLMTQVRDGAEHYFWNPGATQPIRISSLFVTPGMFSRDLRYALTFKDEKTVQVIDTTTGDPAGPPVHEDDRITNAGLHPDGSRLVTMTGTMEAVNPGGGTVRLWKTDDGNEVPLQNVPRTGPGRSFSGFGASPAVSFTADGHSLLATLYGGVHAWNPVTGQERFALAPTANGSLSCYQPQENGPLVCTNSGGDIMGRVRTLDPDTGKPLGPEISAPIIPRDLTLSPDGGRLVGIGNDNTLQVWNMASGQVQAVLKLSAAASDWSVSPDGLHVAATTLDHAVRVWKTSSGQPVTPLLKHDRPVDSAAFSPDGRLVLTVSGDAVRLWATRPPAADAVRLAVGSTVESAQLSTDGKRAATVTTRPHSLPGEEAAVDLWDADTGRRLAGPFPGYGAKLSPDGRKLLFSTGRGQPLSSGADVKGEMWIFTQGDERPRKLSTESTDRMMYVLLGGGTRVVAVYGRNNPGLVWTARLWEWDEARGDFVAGPDVDVVALPWHGVFGDSTPATSYVAPDGLHYLNVVQQEGDRVARVVSLRTGQVVADLRLDDAPADAPSRVAPLAVFSPDGGRVLLLHSSGRCGVWDLRTGGRLSQLPGLWWSVKAGGGAPGPGSGLGEVSFSPDGKRLLLTGVAGGAVSERTRVWDADVGQFLDLPLSEEYGVISARHSPDGRRIVTVDFGGGVRVWDAATGEPVTQAFVNEGVSVRAGFTPDSRWVTTERDQQYGTSEVNVEARLWDAATGQPLSPWLTGPKTLWLENREGRAVAVTDAGGRLLQSDSGGVFVQELSPESRPVEELRNLAQVLAVRRVNDFGRLQKLEHDQFVAGWRQLRDGTAAGRNTGVLAALDWNRRMARECGGNSNFMGYGVNGVMGGNGGLNLGLQLGQLGGGLHIGGLNMGGMQIGSNLGMPNPAGANFAVAWHRDRLIAAEPDRPEHYRDRGLARAGQRRWQEALDDLTRAIDGGEPGLREVRGDVNAQLGRWKEAAADFQEALRTAPFYLAGGLRIKAAMAKLGGKDFAGYRKDCNAMLDHYEAALDRGEPNWFDPSVLTLTEDAIDDVKKLRNVIAKRQGGPGGPQFVSRTGPLLYRMGELEAARNLLEPALRPDSEEVTDLFFLAMTLHKNDSEKAKAALALGVRRMEERRKLPPDLMESYEGLTGWQLRLVDETLRREAEETLKK